LFFKRVTKVGKETIHYVANYKEFCTDNLSGNRERKWNEGNPKKPKVADLATHPYDFSSHPDGFASHPDDFASCSR